MACIPSRSYPAPVMHRATEVHVLRRASPANRPTLSRRSRAVKVKLRFYPALMTTKYFLGPTANLSTFRDPLRR